MKSTVLQKQAQCSGRSCIVDSVNGTYFNVIIVNIWECAALLNYEHNLSDWSLD